MKANTINKTNLYTWTYLHLTLHFKLLCQFMEITNPRHQMLTTIKPYPQLFRFKLYNIYTIYNSFTFPIHDNNTLSHLSFSSSKNTENISSNNPIRK